MERKTDQFFDGDKVSLSKIITMLQQYPQDAERIMDFVFKKIEHFTEFRVKKDHLKEKYDHKMKDLYAEYMSEEE